jgi:hypothetical protein
MTQNGHSELQTRKALEGCPRGASGSNPGALIHNSGEAGIGLVLTHDSLNTWAEDAVDRTGVAEADFEYVLEQ